MEHTPTPWGLCYDGQIDGNNGHCVIKLPFSSYKEFCDNSILQANSRFIVKACNAYESNQATIKELVEALGSVLHEFDGLFLKEESQHKTLNQAREALKRAKGE